MTARPAQATRRRVGVALLVLSALSFVETLYIDEKTMFWMGMVQL